MTNEIEEIWKGVVDYENLYLVSNLGRVKSLDRIVKTTNRGDYLRKGKIFSLSVDTIGYQCVGLTIDSKTIVKKVHRLVALAFIPNPENKPQINHLDGNKLNNAFWNLEWSTAKENTQHAIRTGLNTFHKKNADFKGEKASNSILKESQVLEIRNKYKPFEYSASKLAKEYNVSQSCITHILNNTSWKHLKNVE